MLRAMSDSNGVDSIREWIGRVGVQPIIASALFWAWFDLAVYRPTLFLPFSDDMGVYRVFFIVAMACGALPLLLAALMPNRSEPLLGRRTSWLIATVAAVAGSAGASVAGMISSCVLAVISGAMVGACLGVFQLVWSKVYAIRGAKTASALLPLSIGLGSLADFSVFGLPEGVAAIVASCLPAVSFALMMTSSVIGARENGLKVAPPAGEQLLSLDSIFGDGRVRILGLSLSLAAAFLIYGFSFAYDQYLNVFSAARLDAASSDILLITRGLTALAVFFAIYLFPNRMYAVFRTGILVGVAGCVAAPSLGLLLDAFPLSGVFIAVGYTTIDVITWTLLSEVSLRADVGVSITLGAGRFLIHTGFASGFAVVSALMLGTFTTEHLDALNSTVGYLMVIAEMLLLGENAGLWLLARVSVAPRVRVPGAPVSPESNPVTEAVVRFGLTDREAEVLRLLLAGRSRARIAQGLGISENTVNSHALALYRKLGVHNRQELLDLLG